MAEQKRVRVSAKDKERIEQLKEMKLGSVFGQNDIWLTVLVKFVQSYPDLSEQDVIVMGTKAIISEQVPIRGYHSYYYAIDNSKFKRTDLKNEEDSED